MSDKEYFKSIESSYQNVVITSDILYMKCSELLNRYVNGNVLDFGNGGIVHYSLERITKLVCQDLIFEKKLIGPEKISYVFGDFYDFKPMIQADVVIAQYLFHHLDNNEMLVRSLKLLKHSMSDNSKLLIIEVKLPEFVRFIQFLSQPLITRTLKFLNKPSIRFFSFKSLSRLLNKADFEIIHYEQFNVEGQVNPAPVIFPRLSIPGWLYPFKMMFVVATPRKN